MSMPLIVSVHMQRRFLQSCLNLYPAARTAGNLIYYYTSFLKKIHYKFFNILCIIENNQKETGGVI